MPTNKRNDRRSQWRVVNRCLDLLLRLLRGSATGADLLAIVRDDDPEDVTDSEARKRFENDRKRLRDWFRAELTYDRPQDTYTLIDVGRPLLDLPDDGVRALAFLQQTFDTPTAPMADDIRALLDSIMMVLPAQRLKQVNKQRGLLEVELGARDEDEISDDVWNAVQTSTSERRQLEFDYVSLSNTSGIPTRYLAEPIRYFFDTSRKHYYIEFFCLEARGPAGVASLNGSVLRFRLGRMSNPVVLPTHFPPNRRIPKKELVYELTPEVARLGVTRHFDEMQVIPNDDGSATVRVLSSNLFFDLRTLLYYGPNCKVIGGDEAVREMQKIVNGLTLLYSPSKT